MSPITPELNSPPTVAAMGSGRPKRILIVDDDPKVCAHVVALLRQRGNQVETAEDGEAAWAALLSTPFDLMVTDHFMPKVSGLALARRIRVAHLPVLVVLASEKLEEADTVNLSHDPWSRIDGLVHKPFTGSELLAAVSSLLLDRRATPSPLDNPYRAEQNESGLSGIFPANSQLQPSPDTDKISVG